MASVVDASSLAEYLVGSPVGRRVAEALEADEGGLHLPHLAVVEVTSVLRAWVRRREIPERRAAAALTDLADFPARRWPAEPLLPRVWELRDAVSAYDATYVALAEALDARLVTGDARLARAVESLDLMVVVVGRHP